jgi:hypothetical protein
MLSSDSLRIRGLEIFHNQSIGMTSGMTPLGASQHLKDELGLRWQF